MHPTDKILCDPLHCCKLSYPHTYEATLLLPPPASPSPECPPQMQEHLQHTKTLWHQLGAGSDLRALLPSDWHPPQQHEALSGSRDVPVGLICEPLRLLLTASLQLISAQENSPLLLGPRGPCVISTRKTCPLGRHSHPLYPLQWVREPPAGNLLAP